MLPSLFVNHGSPFMITQPSPYTKFLGELGKRYPAPKALVVFSAHWEERETTVSFAEGTLETIYDFYGFPENFYTVKYPAQGSPEVAALVERKFQEAGVAVKRGSRGLDHGAWVFLRYMYPEANIPVVTVSVHPFLAAAEQYRIGSALRGLGADDILVIGSGTTIHNFQYIKFGQTTPEQWAIEFDEWLIARFADKDVPALLDYEARAPWAARAVPRAEHFVPLFLAYGAADPAAAAEVLYRGYEMGTFSNTCLAF